MHVIVRIDIILEMRFIFYHRQTSSTLIHNESEVVDHIVCRDVARTATILNEN